MRSLYLIRHAKSSWDNPLLKDKLRPLNSRGKQDAPLIGNILSKLGAKPDIIITSPAKRAKSTAKRIAHETGYKESDIILNDFLYMAGIEDFVKVIKDISDKNKEVMLFSHNYGITDFANYISNSDIENIPTCGAVKIVFEFDTWKKIEKEKGKLAFFEYPKKYKDGK
ncbi:MAG: histidine phosphatase family protein [Ignavibacteria bacterium]